MLKILRLVCLVGLLVLSTSATVKGLFWIGEHYFFDKLFYNKSRIHGYGLTQFNFPQNPNLYHISSKLKSRISDLYSLVYQSSTSEKNVLGTSDNQIYEIALIGDSYVYGVGVQEHERLSVILEKKLQKLRPTKVYNYSYPGDNAIDNYSKFLMSWESKPLNLYIFGMVYNDLVLYPDNYLTRYPNESIIFQKLLIYCSQLLLVKSDQDELPPGENYDNHYKLTFSDDYGNVCLLDQIARKLSGLPILFIKLDNVGDFDLQNHPSPIAWVYDKYSEILKRHAISMKWVFADPYFKEKHLKLNNYGGVSKTEAHPSQELHSIYAEFLFKEITGNLKYNFIQ